MGNFKIIFSTKKIDSLVSVSLGNLPEDG